MTPSEIYTERMYLITERLGIMCGTGKPTPEQLQEAKDSADREIARILSTERSKDTVDTAAALSGARRTM